MKFKFLFLGMLAAAAMVGCNNDVVGPGEEGYVDPETGVAEGLSTHATFEIKFASPTTYAGSLSEPDQNAGESKVYDATLVIYKLDGTPEAIGYMNATDFSGTASGAAGVAQKITLRCYSGTKLIYLAVNTGVKDLIRSGNSVTSTSNTTTPSWLGDDWTANTADAVKFDSLNAPLWSRTGTAPSVTLTGPYATAPASATGLIYALSNSASPSATPTVTAVGSAGNGFLMTNWGDKDYQNTDANGMDPYAATVKFTLKPAITASDSRAAAADATNANGKNALKINIQRALAKVQVNAIAGPVLSGAGTPALPGDTVYVNSGSFAPDNAWAFGNLNVSEYPFQQWNGTILKSTLYDSLNAIVDTITQVKATWPSIGYTAANNVWEKVIDNSRWCGSKTYSKQDLTVADVRAAIGTTTAVAPNVGWAAAAYAAGEPNRVYVTENNNRNTLNAYSSFVVFAGKYTPTKYISAVNSAKGITWGTGDPTYTTTPTTDKDTLYYVQNTDTTGVFIWGKGALRQFVGWYILGTIATYDPATSPSSAPEIAAAALIQDYIENLMQTNGNVPAKLQAYWQGYCFYRIFIRDRDESLGQNIVSIRRNHIYSVTISKIKGPGISDPNDIVDPHPEEPEPLEEAETWVTAEINIMKWHVVSQSDAVGLN